MKSNIMLKIAVALVLIALVVVIVVVKPKGGNKPGVKVSTDSFGGLSSMESGPVDPNNGLSDGGLDNLMLEKEMGVDTDSPLETMKTLTNETRAVRQDSELLQDKLKIQEQKTSALLKMESTIQKRMDSKFNRQEREFRTEVDRTKEQRKDDLGEMSVLRKKIDDLLNNGLEIQGRKKGSSSSSNGEYPIGDDIPSGLGFDENTGESVNYDQIVWIDPLDSKKDFENPGQLAMPDFAKRFFSEAKQLSPASFHQEKLDKEQRSIRAYTIPVNATLLASTGMTALVGRIPVDGNVDNPYRFKLLVGPDNLSSNDVRIPGIEGITMSGTTTGDWTLSCVSATVFSMTFTFQDGTIVTYPEPGTKTGDPIAWISDRNGHPCVTGERITNAPTYLASRIGLTAAEAYAKADAASQFITIANENGNLTKILDGSANTVAQNTAIASGLRETSDWLDKRQADSFDVIYVEPGVEVAVHVVDQINIDYDPEGRKVNHYADLNRRSASNLD